MSNVGFVESSLRMVGISCFKVLVNDLVPGFRNDIQSYSNMNLELMNLIKWDGYVGIWMDDHFNLLGNWEILKGWGVKGLMGDSPKDFSCGGTVAKEYMMHGFWLRMKDGI